MAKYLVLIYDDESGWAAGGPAAEAGSAAHRAFGQAFGDAIVGGEALGFASTATTIRDGVVTDGPFIETKEVLGGYYLIEVEDLDAAITIAREVPVPFGGGVEVRPVAIVG